MMERTEAQNQSVHSRRKFFSYGFVAATYTGFGLSVIPNLETLTDSQRNLEGPLVIGDNDVYSLQINHDENALRENKGYLDALIPKFSVVIPEYFPPEYQSVKSSPIFGPLVNLYNAGNALFDYTAELFERESKNIWVVDPAYSEAMIEFRVLLDVSTVAGGGTIAYQVMKRVATTRRQFILGNLGLPATGVPFSLDVENDLRQVLSAEQLSVVFNKKSSQRPSRKNILLINTESHWKGIKQNLLDKQSRLNRLQIYKDLFQDVFPDLFVARHYPNGVFRENIERQVI